MTQHSPLFQSVFGEAWEHLPPVMRKHYDVRPGSNDMVVVEGALDVERSRLARLLSPVLRLYGALMPYSGKQVPVTVRFTSPPGTRHFVFDRVLRFPGHSPYRFHSHMEHRKNDEMVEFMRFGIGWRSRYAWDGQRVRLHHAGYVWRIFGLFIPLPLELLLGRSDAWEEPLSDDSFRMEMAVVHPWFGKTYSYGGTFRVTEVCHG